MKTCSQARLLHSCFKAALIVVSFILLAEVDLRATDHSAKLPADLGNWDRQVAFEIEPGVAFTVVSTASIDGHLSAGCGYQYLAERGPVVLHGMKEPNSDLSPFVTYEIATQAKTKWKTIGKFTESKNPAKLEVGPTNPRVLLQVDMEPFRSSIGNVRWGRLTLENGDAAVFAIDDLLPTGNSPAAGAGNFKQDINDLDPRRFGSLFELVSVVSFSHHIIGNFVFIGSSTVSSAEVKGTKSPDGDFWPDVTLQAGNSDKTWQSVEKPSQQHGTAASLNVNNQSTLLLLRIALDGYKPVLGRFKYGKVIFSGGEFAVFSLDDLKPKP